MASEDVLHRYAAMLLSGGSSRTADAAMMEALAAEVRELRGAMKADDERLRVAGERVGLLFGCDTAEVMADLIEELRKDKARLDYLLDHLERDWRFPRWTHHRDLIDAAIRDAAMGGEG